MVAPSVASDALTMLSASTGCGPLERALTRVSTRTVSETDKSLPAASSTLTTRSASYSPSGTTPGPKLAVQLPAASTVACRVTPPRDTETVDPGSTVPVMSKPLAATAPLMTPVPSVAVARLGGVTARLSTRVSTRTAPSTDRVLPAASVIVAVTAG